MPIARESVTVLRVYHLVHQTMPRIPLTADALDARLAELDDIEKDIHEERKAIQALRQIYFRQESRGLLVSGRRHSSMAEENGQAEIPKTAANGTTDAILRIVRSNQGIRLDHLIDEVLRMVPNERAVKPRRNVSNIAKSLVARNRLIRRDDDRFFPVG